MAAKAKAAAKRASTNKKVPNPSQTKTIALLQHDPTRPPPLNPKDQITFKEILHQYENKQYTAGLENCNALLAKYPGHGETTAMAGLLHHSLNDKQKGHTLVKAGPDLNYAEAVKSYAQAHRLDPENNNILRDLAVLQIQMRQYGAYVESRWRMLRINKRISNSLDCTSDAALELLDAMENFEVTYEPDRCFERSELVLFKASITSPPQKALEYLESHSTDVLDRSGYLLARARLLTDLGRTEAAEWAWLDLIDGNTESRTYLNGYIHTKILDGQSSNMEILTYLTERYPTSKLIQRTILDHAIGTQFEAGLESYLYNRLSKGIPSVFNDIKPLLADPEKARIIRAVAERLRSQFEHSSDANTESPSTYLWILHFLAQLYSSSALWTHFSSPGTHVYKRAGAFTKAADALRVARELDGQDRFLNSKCAKYILRSIRAQTDRETQSKLLTETRKLIGIYTRKDAPDPVSDLVEMQAIWYIAEEAEVGLRVGDWGVALKRFHQIVDIYQVWEEDQYDFHTYCTRKSTLQSYINLLKFEDTLYTHPQYFRAVSQAIQIYLTLHDRRLVKDAAIEPKEFNILAPPEPNQSESTTTNGTSPTQTNGKPEETAMSKKALKKVKMAEMKAKAQATIEAKKAMSKMKGQDATTTAPTPEVVPPIKDDDPIGEKLVKTEKPLEKAIELLKPIELKLGQKGVMEMEVWLLRFEIELRKGKPLLALKALLKARSCVDSITPKIFHAMEKLQNQVKELQSIEKEVIQNGLQSLEEEVDRKKQVDDDEWNLAFGKDLMKFVAEEGNQNWKLGYQAWERLKKDEGFRILACKKWGLVEEFQLKSAQLKNDDEKIDKEEVDDKLFEVRDC
ncbi:NMDA receptor-regulated protein 1-domain-containing protein [Melampsora americana]|nr:NMDA receptor-regulated protein 1-domain-containing protein [Melampsora americana]